MNMRANMTTATVASDMHFLAVKPLSKKSTTALENSTVILTTLRHNLREMYADGRIQPKSDIDLDRSNSNVILMGASTASEGSIMAETLMLEAGIAQPRKNATMGIELVVSLPASLKIDQTAYFESAALWAKEYFNVPLLSAVVHLDQENPHAHIVLLPLKEGRLAGSALLGNRSSTKAMHASFHENVGKKFGMNTPGKKRKLTLGKRRQQLDLVARKLRQKYQLSQPIISVLLKPHLNDPASIFAALDCQEAWKPSKHSFVEIMTRPCKVERERFVVQ
ncbi:plasmid recombination protein [Pseudoduganella sp. R-43]|uniref:plasmid recombination protein n=1 Tax=Pseudoduganella sp. R-43 TaxID=3404063 RepID=UPI003CF554BE